MDKIIGLLMLALLFLAGRYISKNPYKLAKKTQEFEYDGDGEPKEYVVELNRVYGWVLMIGSVLFALLILLNVIG